MSIGFNRLSIDMRSSNSPGLLYHVGVPVDLSKACSTASLNGRSSGEYSKSEDSMYIGVMIGEISVRTGKFCGVESRGDARSKYLDVLTHNVALDSGLVDSSRSVGGRVA